MNWADAQRVHPYVLLARPPERARYWFKLRNLAAEITCQLNADPRISQHVAGIAGLMVGDNGGAATVKSIFGPSDR